MIIEKFHEGKVKALYQRFDEKGRMVPDGVKYIDSWINEDVTICYQLMESRTKELLNNWIEQWKDLADLKLSRSLVRQKQRKRCCSQIYE